MIRNWSNEVYVRKEVIKLNINEYARINGCSWITAKKRINGVTRKKRKKMPSILDEYKFVIDDKIDNYLCSAKSIFEFIKLKGYNGSYETVKNYRKTHVINELNKATLRIETTPGLQGQVDWKEEFKLILKSGEILTFNIFLFVLSYSRYKYIELTLDRTQPTLFKCLINAFKYCEGIPSEIWFDNMKTVVDVHDPNSGEVTFNERFLAFTKDMDYKPIACRCYRPQTKGSIEIVAKLMDRIKVMNDELNNLKEVYEYIKKFNENINNEICQAIGLSPITLYKKEKECLKHISASEILSTYESLATRKVQKDSMIVVNNVRYSLPVKYIGKVVEINIENNNLYIYYNKNLIRIHEISEKVLNYHKSDVEEIMASDVYKKKTPNEINQLADEYLKKLDKANFKKGDI